MLHLEKGAHRKKAKSATAFPPNSQTARGEKKKKRRQKTSDFESRQPGKEKEEKERRTNCSSPLHRPHMKEKRKQTAPTHKLVMKKKPLTRQGKKKTHKNPRKGCPSAEKERKRRKGARNELTFHHRGKEGKENAIALLKQSRGRKKKRRELPFPIVSGGKKNEKTTKNSPTYVERGERGEKKRTHALRHNTLIHRLAPEGKEKKSVPVPVSKSGQPCKEGGKKRKKRPPFRLYSWKRKKRGGGKGSITLHEGLKESLRSKKKVGKGEKEENLGGQC